MASTLLFLIFVGVLLPFVSWRSYRFIANFDPNTDEIPSSNALTVQALIVQGVVMGLALACVFNNGIAVPWLAKPGLLPVATALGILTVFFGIAQLEIRLPPAPGDALRQQFRREGYSVLALVTVITAALVEEYAYRGVLYLLLEERLQPQYAAAISAMAFGLAHFGQGWRGVMISAGFGLSMQFLCHLSGGLVLAVGTHLLYDLGILWMGSRIKRRKRPGSGS